MSLNPLLKFAALPIRNKLLLFQAAGHLAVAWVLVRVTDYEKLAGAVQKPHNSAAPSFAVQDIKWSLEAISRRMPGAHCLVQSFAAVRLFRRFSYPAELKLGVAKPNGKFSAHAWVELNGKIVIGGADSIERFTPFGATGR